MAITVLSVFVSHFCQTAQWFTLCCTILYRCEIDFLLKYFSIYSANNNSLEDMHYSHDVLYKVENYHAYKEDPNDISQSPVYFLLF